MPIRNFPVNPKIILKKSPGESKGTKNQDSDMPNKISTPALIKERNA